MRFMTPEEGLMESTSGPAPVAKARSWTGRVLSALAILFLSFDAVIKFTGIAPVRDSFAQLGYPPSLGLPIGVLELVCLAVYVIPRTSVLGAILLTGYLGGAVATHVRVGSPLLTHALFPIYVGVLVWAGLFLREDRLRALVPLRSERAKAAGRGR